MNAIAVFLVSGFYCLIILVPAIKMNKYSFFVKKNIFVGLGLFAYILFLHNTLYGLFLPTLISSLLMFFLVFYLYSRKRNASFYYAAFSTFIGIYAEFLSDAILQHTKNPLIISAHFALISTLLSLFLLAISTVLFSSIYKRIITIDVPQSFWFVAYIPPVLGIILAYMFSEVVENNFGKLVNLERVASLLSIVFFSLYAITLIITNFFFIKSYEEKLKSIQYELLLSDYNFHFAHLQGEHLALKLGRTYCLEQLSELKRLIQEKRYNTALATISELDHSYSMSDDLVITGLPTVDDMASTCVNLAKKEGVDIEFFTQFSEPINIPITELTYLFGNMFEHSVDAFKQNSNARKSLGSLHFSIETHKGLLTIRSYFATDCNDTVISNEQPSKSISKKAYTFDIQALKDVVEQNGGVLNYTDNQDGVFFLEMILFNVQHLAYI